MAQSGASRPNILLIMADQLRRDALGCYGNPVARTPNIDGLARDGVRLDHFFSQSPVCQPSRATIATGRYPHVHGVKANWYDLPASERTLQGELTASGYHTRALGKMHFEPTSDLHGFQDRVFVEGKMFAGPDEYRSHLHAIGRFDDYIDHVRKWDDEEDFGASPSPFEPDDYIDVFLANRAAPELASLPEPFFAWASFVNPHMPFDPPRPYDSLFDPEEIPLPEDWRRPQGDRVPEHRISSGGKDFSALTEARLRKVRSYYYGLVSLVDDCVGRLLAVLAERRIASNTVVIFTTDHGELLGHRGMLWKGGQLLYDHLVHIPFIVRYPPEVPPGKVVSDLAEGTDVMPTCLDYAGVAPPDGVQGASLRPVLRQDAIAPGWRDAAFAEGREVKMLRDYNWKLILYPGRRYGEMYDIRSDPLELRNLWNEPAYAPARAELVYRLATRMALGEDPLPRPTRRPGYFELSGFHPAQELG